MADEKKYGSKYWLNKLIASDSLDKELERIDGIRVIKGTGVPVTRNSTESPIEKLKENWLETYLASHKIINNEHPFCCWWVEHKEKRPTWDYICQATMGGKEGLILLEAKAHRNETSRSKKQEPKKKEKTTDDSFEIMKNNHIRIENNITSQLNELGGEYSGYYQISNRIAYANKVRKTLELPVLLVFLGFINMDSHFPDRFMTKPKWEDKIEEALRSLKLEHLTKTPIQDLIDSPGIRILSYPDK